MCEKRDRVLVLRGGSKGAMGSLVKGVFPNPGNTTEVKEWRRDGEEKGAITGNLWIILDIKRKKKYSEKSLPLKGTATMNDRRREQSKIEKDPITHCIHMHITL